MFAELAAPGAGALALAVLAFLAGGLVKGTLGIGLPLVALPLLSLGWPPTTAIAMLAVPVLGSNLWQTWDSGLSRAGLLRFWPLMVVLPFATAITVLLTLDLPEATLRRGVAATVLLTVALNAMPLRLNVPPRQERWWSAVVGVLSGAMGGVSSLTGPLIISYLMSLRLPRDVFVGTISAIYLCSAAPLYGTIALQGRLGLRELLWSLAALVPMSLGLSLGKRVRGRLSEQWFRRVLLAFLSLLALMLMLKS